MASSMCGTTAKKLLALGLAASLGLVLACTEKRRPGRLLLVGIDGASMRIVAPMLERGELPNLAAISAAGVSGLIRSQKPIDSPPVWNTIVTGMHPRKHGISSFAHVDGEGKKHLFLSTDRKVPAVWNILSEAGFTVGVVNLWNTYPPDRINGVMISDHVLAREVDGRAKINKAEIPAEGTTVYPETWAATIDQLLDAEPLTQIANPFRDNDGLPRWVLKKDLIRRYEEDEALARVALAILEQERPDLMLVLLPGVDRVSHHLWGNVEPSDKYPPRLHPSPEQRRAGRGALETYYRYADALVGLLAQDYGPDDLVIVMSDHGFEAGTALMYLTGKHVSEAAIDGILFARGAGVGPIGGSVSDVSVRDVTPTVLAFFGIPLGQDMDGQPMSFLTPATEISRIPSHAGTPIERVTAAPSGVEADIIERLRMIGYLEE